MTRLLLSLSALGLLAGCGIPGGLKRPDPMWNAEEAIRYECTRELRRNEVRDARCTQQTQARDPNAPFVYDAASAPRDTSTTPQAVSPLDTQPHPAQ